MNYIIRITGGNQVEITQEQRDKLMTVLLLKKAERPDYLEIGEGGTVISTASISCITEKKGW